MDRKRKGKKLSNQDWVSRSDPEAKIHDLKQHAVRCTRPTRAIDNASQDGGGRGKPRAVASRYNTQDLEDSNMRLAARCYRGWPGKPKLRAEIVEPVDGFGAARTFRIGHDHYRC